jgi:hypothetical protein
MRTALLTRDQFREAVFARDKHKCVICKEPAKDAHHIMERRLFTETDELGGYFLDNGASLCGDCHKLAEGTFITCERIREAAGITKVVLPKHLYQDEQYDKWGNIFLPNGGRMKGELFHDESVQKVLFRHGALVDFTDYVKYPRTHHLPWSLGMHDDDRMHSSTNQWEGKQVVVTLKMDGENTTMYRDHIHARSIDSKNHPSRNWVKNFWSKIAHEIPKGWRICGENLYAKHSIGYEDLPSYFLGFSIWDERNFCLPLENTLEWFELLGIYSVPILFSGMYNEDTIKQIHKSLNFDRDEGYVLRTQSGFYYGEFKKYVGKFVRPDHIKTTKHWMHGQPLVPNKLS